MMHPEAYAGPIVVTTVYGLLWYGLLFGVQSRTKFRLRREARERGEAFDRYDGRHREMLAADRIVGNTLEQMVPFLASLWLCALFFSTTVATVLGSIYVITRAAYPFLMGRELGTSLNKHVYLATFPGYAINITMLLLPTMKLILSLMS